MERTPGEDRLELIRTSGATVDQHIANLAKQPIHEAVTIAEGKKMNIGFPKGNKNAAMYLVGRLFTDAVFSQDIRAIQLIINRIDGGLPKDTELDNYQTLFGDCLSEVMNTTDGTQLKVMPDDTVMMAMCKSLYSIAVNDIYWDSEKQRERRPTDADKKERDAALRMVLERTGGRKTLQSAHIEEERKLEVAPWIKQLSPGQQVNDVL